MVAKTKHTQFTVKEAKVIGEKLGVDWETFDVKQFCFGLNAELQDGTYNPMTNFASSDPILIGKVVRAHLNEAPDYYTRWALMEKEAEREHRSKHVDAQKE